MLTPWLYLTFILYSPSQLCFKFLCQHRILQFQVPIWQLKGPMKKQYKANLTMHGFIGFDLPFAPTCKPHLFFRATPNFLRKIFKKVSRALHFRLNSDPGSHQNRYWTDCCIPRTAVYSHIESIRWASCFNPTLFTNHLAHQQLKSPFLF